MRKLLLVLFLLSISSNALAEEDIWKCNDPDWDSIGPSYDSTEYIKIDTSKKPYVQLRKNAKWTGFFKPEAINPSIEYSKEENAIYIYRDNEQNKKIMSMAIDLIKLEVVVFDIKDNTVRRRFFCKIHIAHK